MYSSMRIGPSFNGVVNGNYKTVKGAEHDIYMLTDGLQDRLTKEIANEISPAYYAVREDFSVNGVEIRLVDHINGFLKKDHNKKLPNLKTISEFSQSPEGVYIRASSGDGVEYTLGYSYNRDKPMELD